MHGDRNAQKMTEKVLCPRDGAAMDEMVERPAGGEVVLDLCPNCAGLWLDGGEIAKITGEADFEEFLAGLPARESNMQCPRCSGVMQMKRFANLEVDVCTMCHGGWFDPSELESLQIEYRRQTAPKDAVASKPMSNGLLVYWALHRPQRAG